MCSSVQLHMQGSGMGLVRFRCRIADENHTGRCYGPVGSGQSWKRLSEHLRERNLVYVPMAEGGPGVRRLKSGGEGL